MKKEFEVIIEETLRKKVIVEAEDADEAEQIVSDNWHKGEYILDADNFIDVDFKAEKAPSEQLIGIIYNWKGLKEENYLYTLDEVGKYDIGLLKDCLNNPGKFVESEKIVAANKTWDGRLLETPEEVKDFLCGRWNTNIKEMKENNPDTDYSDWYWENVLDNDLYGEKSDTLRKAVKKYQIWAGAVENNHCPVCRGKLEKVNSENIEYRCFRCGNTY